MSERMLVTQALDERDLLVKKINDKIAKASFVDTIKPNEDKVYAKKIDTGDLSKEQVQKQILESWLREINCSVILITICNFVTCICARLIVSEGTVCIATLGEHKQHWLTRRHQEVIGRSLCCACL